MTRDDIIRMAREAGIKGPATARQGFKMFANPQRLEQFAALVAAAEREACAQLCERVTARQNDGFDDAWEWGIEKGAERCAAAIRARKR